MLQRRTTSRALWAVMLWSAAGMTTFSARGVAAQQSPAQAVASVRVSGAGLKTLTLTAADLRSMPRASARTESNGIVTTYEGVWVAEVMKKAGVPLGDRLRGAALSTYVLAEASDGYQVLFSLGELDPDMSGGQVLLADQANGASLFGETGAFRLVVASDKRGARSVRMLSELQIVSLRP